MKHYKEFNPVMFNTYQVSKKEKRELVYKAESDDILTFDIEVSSAWVDDDGNVIPYKN